MKKISYFFILLVLFITSTLPSQVPDTLKPTNGPKGGHCREILTIGDELYAAFSSRGILSSKDKGLSWAVKGLDGENTTGLAVSQRNLFTFIFNSGMYRSTDLGENWSVANKGLPGYSFMSIFSTDSTIFTSIMISGIYRSTDNGANWYNASQGLNSFEGINEWGMKGDTIFALGNYIYRSTNDGKQWEQIGKSLTKTRYYSFLTHNNDIIVGIDEGGIAISYDNGDNWIQPSNALSGKTVQSLWAAGSYLYAGTIWSGDGIYRSSDNGLTWDSINSGLENMDIWNISSIDDVLLAGTNGSGFYRSTDYGDSWTESNEGVVAASVTDLLSFAGNLFASTWGAGIFCNINLGNSWEHVPGTNSIEDLKHCYVIAVEGNKIFAGSTNGLYSSPDSGKTWSKINNKTINDIHILDSLICLGTYEGFLYSTDNGKHWYNPMGGLPEGYIYKVAASSNVIMVTTYNSGVYRSIDQGKNWTAANSGILNVYSFYDIIFFKDNWLLGTDQGLYKSTDDGLSWIKTDFSDESVSCFKTYDNYIFAVKNGSEIYFSSDAANWTKIDVMPSKYSITAIEIMDGKIYLGTEEAGVWFTILPELTGVTANKNTVPEKFQLFQNYPNPFNPTTKIKYSIPSVETVRTTSVPTTIKVYDVLGNEISTLVDEDKVAGNYMVEFNADNFPSGIYFYRIKAGNYLQTNKMLLIK